MYWALGVYAGGVLLRAILCHGLLQNPSCTQTSIELQFVGCITWPIQLVLRLFKK